ncbi:CinA family protein [Flavobacterium sp. DG1-102-2]|uniref:CinA family protein n=1 Tax=Flavobacterium sp. DG1-102-2 TaxID=3081663 RepID=UPI00294A899A|nr:CinA family protein [Flavobacterium sp. DG1-102-2]MDV6167148.1 CinA family protein [Flavobacterium sp. DG1-102-2]
MPSKIVIDCARTIARQKLNIAFVESATAGRMCSEFSLTPHSGDILRGGISCYEVFIKEHILKVPPKLIKDFTPESAEVTAALAEHSSKLFKSDITVAVTGLTAPGGSETAEKPVGTMFLHILLPKGFIVHAEVYSGTSEQIVLKTVDKAAELIRGHLNKN